MASGSGGHQTALIEIGSVRLLAPQHEATGGRVRIGLCPAEIWFDVRGILRFCNGNSTDEYAQRFSGPGGIQEALQKGCPDRGVASFRHCVIMCARSVPVRQTEREFIRICTCIWSGRQPMKS